MFGGATRRKDAELTATPAFKPSFTTEDSAWIFYGLIDILPGHAYNNVTESSSSDAPCAHARKQWVHP